MKLKLFKRDSNPAAVASKNDSLLNTSNWAMVDKNPYEIHDDRPSAQQELLSRKDESDVDVYSKLDDIGVGHSRSGTSKSAATGLDEESFGSSGSGGVERAEFVDNTADSSDQSAAMSVTNPNPFSSKQSGTISYIPASLQPLPVKVILWTEHHVRQWLLSLTPPASPATLSIFQDYEISGLDLDLLNHAKLAVMGLSTATERNAILQAIRELGVDVPVQPTIMSMSARERKILVRAADKNKELPGIPPMLCDKDDIPPTTATTTAPQSNIENKKAGFADTKHTRGQTTGSFRSFKSTISQFTISDYFKRSDISDEDTVQPVPALSSLPPPVAAGLPAVGPVFSSQGELAALAPAVEEDKETFEITMQELRELTMERPALSVLIPQEDEEGGGSKRDTRKSSAASSSIGRKKSLASLFMQPFRRRETKETLNSSKTSASSISPVDTILSSSASTISATSSIHAAMPPISTVQDKLRVAVEGLDVGEAVIKGWMAIRQGNGMIWRRRYCMIIDSFLYVSNSSEKFLPILVIEIRESCEIQPTPSESMRPHAFQFTTAAGNVFYFACNSQFEVVQWINVFIRTSRGDLQKSKRVQLVPIRLPERENAMDPMKEYILSPEVLRGNGRGGKSMSLRESMPNGVSQIPGEEERKSGGFAMKEAKYLPERPVARSGFV